jgi:hypothetical protein
MKPVNLVTHNKRAKMKQFFGGDQIELLGTVNTLLGVLKGNRSWQVPSTRQNTYASLAVDRGSTASTKQKPLNRDFNPFFPSRSSLQETKEGRKTRVLKTTALNSKI